MEFLHTLFYFIIAIGLLVAIHEFGHFWVARKSGVKVIRFSIGFGKIVWRYQKKPNDTEYVLSAIPLGGYVKMVDEREGDVSAEDLPFAFNRQSLFKRIAIVAAGPIFNLLLAIFLYWCVFIIGETAMRPLVGQPKANTIAYQAGFESGEEIIAVNGKKTPTWNDTMAALYSTAMAGKQTIEVTVKVIDTETRLRTLAIEEDDAKEPEIFFKRLGLAPWSPVISPIIGKVVEHEAAAQAGLQIDDVLISADGIALKDWMQWVNYVRSRANISIALIIERDGVQLPINITPKSQESIGRIGAGVKIPEGLLSSLQINYSLSPVDALVAAVERTYFYSVTTVKMMGYMLMGKASVENLSGPISIAQYAGQSAEMGLVHFLKFLAIVSVSLGVLNLLPIPVLDGGHLLFYAIEAIKGSPVAESIQIAFQNIGIVLLMLLMSVAVFMDIGRLFE